MQIDGRFILHSFVHHHFPGRVVHFIQDNSSVHSACLVTQWFQNHQNPCRSIWNEMDFNHSYSSHNHGGWNGQSYANHFYSTPSDWSSSYGSQAPGARAVEVLEEHSMTVEDLVSLEPSGETAQASTAPKPPTSSDISVGVVSDTATKSI